MILSHYFKFIEADVKKIYLVANEARAKGFDPTSKVEIPLATSLAEKVVGLISVVYPQLQDSKVSDRILELEKEFGPLDLGVAFKIAEEIAKGKFCRFENVVQAIDAGIRVGFAYSTLGVVSSPIEGYTGIKICKTRNGGDYFAAYFSGPIRSAGTTAMCVALMLIDYMRESFGYVKYDPDEKEVKRYVTENYDYHERVNNLQYLPTEEEIIFLAQNLPIEITGEPSESREVSNYKDLPRVETNLIRGGMCLTFSEGLAQKAQKGLRLLKGLQAKGFKISDWQFLEKYVEIHRKREKGTSDTTPTYIKDIVAGRPVLGYPSRSGAFRLRYGRSRNNGFSATSIHPATMAITDSFLSIGTQLKLEKPTKGCAITSCDRLDGPIVKLKNGSVRKISNPEEAKKIYKDVKEIIYLGDILVPVGDVINRNYEMMKPGYVEEWWNLELQKNAGEKTEVDPFNLDFQQAVNFSEKFKVPLHPKYIYYWTQISMEQLFSFLDWMANAVLAKKIVLPYNKSEQERYRIGKRALELLGVEHDVTIENVVLTEETSKALLSNLGILSDVLEMKRDIVDEIEKISIKMKNFNDVLSAVQAVSGFTIKDKAGVFIGARMGRPEKAKLRKLAGSPNVLFPVGEAGGRLRSVTEATSVGSVMAEFPLYYCEKCKKEGIYFRCEQCGEESALLFYCRRCGLMRREEKCGEHGRCQRYAMKRIDIKNIYDAAVKKLGLLRGEAPLLVKGVRGTSNEQHIVEHLGKGILRAKYGLSVNKDGTIRYDATELPITHFKPIEIRTSVEKLKVMGYEKDVFGNNLENENQILEIFPHDIILPSCPETKDERADEVFFQMTKFVDHLLEKLYSLPKFYDLKTKEELAGQMVVCMAPHNCAGVVGRILGFSQTQSLLASPYMHAAMRRDADGDEAAVMLLLDVLINFSRKFLPGHRGGTQDAPLVLNAKINAGEVDEQILDFEIAPYGIEVYEIAERGGHSSELKIETVRSRLRKGENPFANLGFTHDTENINNGVVNSAYKSLPTMKEKVGRQMELVEKLRAVRADDVASLIVERHFIRDIRGNLRKFSQQEFRCSKCNKKYRRPCLSGACEKCDGRVIFTISEGSIVKYLEPSLELIRKYEFSPYVKQNIELIKSYIESIFGKEKEKQEELKKWF